MKYNKDQSGEWGSYTPCAFNIALLLSTVFIVMHAPHFLPKSLLTPLLFVLYYKHHSGNPTQFSQCTVVIVFTVAPDRDVWEEERRLRHCLFGQRVNLSSRK